MRPEKSILCVVGHYAMVADKRVQVRILSAPRIAKPVAYVVVAGTRRECVRDWVFFITSIPNHGHVFCINRRTRSIGRTGAIVEVPTRHSVKPYEHSRQ